MKEKNNQNKIDFYTEDLEISNILNMLKSKEKIYKKILEGITALGDFKEKIDINVYEIKCNNNQYYIKLWCEDILGKIFLFYATNLEEKEMYKIYQITDNDYLIFDTKLSKNFHLNKDNIELIRKDNIYDFKFGRLITDEKSYYSLFLRNNICYQIFIDFETKANLFKEILKKLNSKETVPTFLEFKLILENLFDLNNINFNYFKFKIYENFNLIFHVESNEITKEKKLIKTVK